MGTEREEAVNELPFWSYVAYIDWYKSKLAKDRGLSRKAQIINFLINLAIALAFILGFIGFIVFPHILLPGLALTACLIACQALSGFGVLATLVKTAYAIYDMEMGWKETLRMMVWGLRYHFNGTPIQTTLMLLGILAIAIVIILSATGTIYIPFLTVFAANALSLEMLEIFWGLFSDIAFVSVAVMGCYLFSYLLGNEADKRQLGRVELPNQINEQIDEKPAETLYNAPSNVNNTTAINDENKNKSSSETTKVNSDDDGVLNDNASVNEKEKQTHNWWPCNPL